MKKKRTVACKGEKIQFMETQYIKFLVHEYKDIFKIE